MGRSTVRLRSKLDDPVLMTAVSFIVPFLAFLPAEEAQASGVVAVVVAGLVTGHHGVRTFSARERLTERTNWLTIQFLVENGVFLLMGLQLESLLRDLDDSSSSLPEVLGTAALVLVLLLVLRIGFVGVQVLLERRRRPRLDAVRQRLTRSATTSTRWRRRADRASTAPVVSTGCRSSGAGSSAAGPTSPTRRASRSPRAVGRSCRGPGCEAWSRSPPPSRSARRSTSATLLITVAFVVAVVSLLLYGGTLPWLIRTLGVSGVDPDRQRAEVAELVNDITATAAAAMGPTDRIVIDGTPIDPDVATETMAWLERVRDARTERDPEAVTLGLAAECSCTARSSR